MWGPPKRTQRVTACGFRQNPPSVSAGAFLTRIACVRDLLVTTGDLVRHDKAHRYASTVGGLGGPLRPAREGEGSRVAMDFTKSHPAEWLPVAGWIRPRVTLAT